MVKKEKTSGKTRQKVYVDKFTSPVSKAVNQLIILVCKLVKIWEPDELYSHFKKTERYSEEDKTQRVLPQPRQVMLVVWILFENRIFMNVESPWLRR